MKHFFQFITFLAMIIVKFLAMVLFRFEVNWLSSPPTNWHSIKLIVLLNHTSLFEPLFIRLAPLPFIWKLSKKLVAPGADITLNRPLVGRIYKLLLPGCTPITRRKDESWDCFLSTVKNDSITAILPEGRMKRADGKDKHGKAMDVRGGVADVLEKIEVGEILFVYSGGLHHIHTPGDKWPSFFKKMKANLELLSISEYKKTLQIDCKGKNGFKSLVISDMNKRLADLPPD